MKEILDSLPIILKEISKKINLAGGLPYLVGGAVRDFYLGKISKDFDIEIFNIKTIHELKTILEEFGKVSYVGESFGVLKLNTQNESFDFSLPRRENKTGTGHKGFEVLHDSTMTPDQAATRRDFTINAIYINLLTGQCSNNNTSMLGLSDLKNGILRHIGPQFSEDPLRVLRAMQFAARFGFSIEPQTVLLCRSLNLNELPKERLWEEWKKLLLKAPIPSIGFLAAKQLHILKYFPELLSLIGVPQNSQWHPEGDVWTHTLMVVDEAAKSRNGNEMHDLTLMLGALCHDFGKPEKTKWTQEKWRALGHEEAGEHPTRTFLNRLTNHKDLIETVVALVVNHLAPTKLFKEQNSANSAIKRLSLKVNIPLLIQVAQADYFGRTIPDAGFVKNFQAGQWMLNKMQELGLDKQLPQPILMGKHLLELGLEPGQNVGTICKLAFELQLDGEINTLEQALEWAKKNTDELK